MRKAQQYRLRGMDPPADLMPTEADVAEGQARSRQAADAAEIAALSMVPGSVVTLPARAALKAGPAALGGLGLLASTSDAGDAASASPNDPMAKIRSAVKGNTTLEAKLSAWEQATKAANEPRKGVRPEEAARLRSESQKRADELQREIFGELERLNPPKRTFESEYPWLSRNLPLVQIGLGTGVGMGLKSMTNAMANAPIKPWMNALRKGSDALERTPPDVARAQRYSNVASEFMADVPKDLSKNAGALERAMRAARNHGSDVAPALVGGYVGAEVAQLPHQYNLRNAPTDSPEYERAVENRGYDTLTGAALGVAGGYGGTHFAPVRVKRAPMAETRALKKNVEAARVAPAPTPKSPEATEGLVPYLQRQVFGSPKQNPPPSQTQTTPVGQQVPPAGRPARYGQAYSQEARPVVANELASTASPDSFKMRDRLMSAFRRAGLPDVSGPLLEKRITRTMDALRQTGKNLSDPKELNDALDAVIGKAGMLAIPAAVGVGAASMDMEERKDGGSVSRAKRAMSKHWEKQNRYARGGTVHRKGMWKKGMREG